jgi:essential nuclear protein 1
MPRPQAGPARSPANRRHNPLAEDISTIGGLLRTKSSTGKRKSRSDEDINGDGYIDAPSSRKILAIAQDLADEDDEDQRAVAKAVAPNPAFAYDSRFEDEEEDPQGAKPAAYDDEEDWMPDEDVEADDIEPDDMAVYNKFLPNHTEFANFAPSIANLSTIDRRKDSIEEPEMVEEGEGQTTNLADLILQRIAEKEALTAAQSSGRPGVHGGGPPEDAVQIPANVAEVFEK